jgi:hypothetical protein
LHGLKAQSPAQGPAVLKDTWDISEAGPMAQPLFENGGKWITFKWAVSGDFLLWILYFVKTPVEM